MKIIGFVKDYFDTIIYSYGIDEKIVVYRNKENKFIAAGMVDGKYDNHIEKNPEHLLISCLNDIRWGTSQGYRGRIIDTQEYQILDDADRNNQYEQKGDKSIFLSSVYINKKIYPIYKKNGDTKFNFFISPRTSGLVCEDAYQSTIDLSKSTKNVYMFFDNLNTKQFIPLSEIKDINKYFPSYEMYQLVCEMHYKDENVSEQTNENKIEAHGFDTKVSFRNRI